MLLQRLEPLDEEVEFQGQSIEIGFHLDFSVAHDNGPVCGPYSSNRLLACQTFVLLLGNEMRRKFVLLLGLIGLFLLALTPVRMPM